MGLDTYIWRRGKTFHFRRRIIRQNGDDRPISISMKTRDPDRARNLARRLAARWDRETEMFNGAHTQLMTPRQKAEIIRAAMEEELVIATGHWLDVPIHDPVAEERRSRVLAAAYDLERQRHAVMQGPSIADELDEADRKIAERFGDLFISRQNDQRFLAHAYLERVGAARTQANYREALLAMYSGRREAQLRSGFIAHPDVAARIDGVAALSDDDFVATLRSNPPTLAPAPEPAPVEPVSPVLSNNNLSSDVASTPAICSGGEFPFAERDERRFSQVISYIIEEKRSAGDWGIDKGDQRRVLLIFAWVTGDKKLCDYRPSDIDEFENAYNLAPPGFGWAKHINASPQPRWDDVKASFKPSFEQSRSNATYNRDLGVLQGACKVLAKTAWKPRSGKNPIIEAGSRKDVEMPNFLDPMRMPWSEDNIRALFNLPLFTGGGGHLKRLQRSKLPRIWHDAAYWVPLIAAYSGAAREEICGLELADVVEGEVPHFWIRANMARSKDGVTPSGMKATPRYRFVPIHPELLRLGLLDYAAAIRKEGHKTLFPELFEIKSGGGTMFYARAWQHIVNAVDAVHPLQRTSDGKRVDFHSLRTYSSSVLSDIDARQAAIDRILGHQPSGTGNRNYERRMYVIGIAKYLMELRTLMVRSFPTVTAHLPQTTVRLLPLDARSRTGQAKDLA